jgi:LPXTG-site transpeptidase (sortase) family protein
MHERIDMMKTRFYLTIGILWIIAGLFMAWPIVQPALKGVQSGTVQGTSRTTDTSEARKNEVPLIKGDPTHITFPSVGTSVDIAPGYFDASSNSWTLSKDKAHFATVTDEPNNKTGNTFIYGHNRWEVFTKLLDLKVGDQATVTTSNGHTFTYALSDIVDIEPTDTSYLETHKSPILTVQTCSGMWYENRRMFTFNLVEAQ